MSNTNLDLLIYAANLYETRTYPKSVCQTTISDFSDTQETKTALSQLPHVKFIKKFQPNNSINQQKIEDHILNLKQILPGSNLINNVSTNSNGAMKLEDKLYKTRAFKNIINAFNDNNILIFQDTLHQFCSPDVEICFIQLPNLNNKGINNILIFWFLIFEAFPDAVISNFLTREIEEYTNEYLFHFMGTRISVHTISSMYEYAMECLRHGKAISRSKILDIVSKSCLFAKMNKVESPLIEATSRHVLSFDFTGKICKWTIDFSI